MRTKRTSARVRRTRSSSDDGALTSSLSGISQLEELACERDRLLEIHGEWALTIGSQPQPPHVLTVYVA